MAATSTLDGHLGEGTEVRGTLRFEGSVRIDGTFSGRVVSPATLILGPKANVEGELQVGKLAVHGKLRGKVKAAEQITIHEQGRVEADLETSRLVIESGAHFNGNCDMERASGGDKTSGSQGGAGESSASAASKPTAEGQGTRKGTD